MFNNNIFISKSHSGRFERKKEDNDGACNKEALCQIPDNSGNDSLVIKDLVYKTKAKTFMRCPRGSSRPRPGHEDDKTG